MRGFWGKNGIILYLDCQNACKLYFNINLLRKKVWAQRMNEHVSFCSFFYSFPKSPSRAFGHTAVNGHRRPCPADARSSRKMVIKQKYLMAMCVLMGGRRRAWVHTAVGWGTDVA